MTPTTMEKKIETILNQLTDGKDKTVVLVGQPGIGKTWMARELSDRAAERSLFDFTLWVFLNRESDRMALCQSFARQLYLLSTAEEIEDDDYDGEGDEEEVEVEKKEEVLRQKISEALAQKSLLLILDDVGKNKKEEIMLELNTLFKLDQRSSYKILITTNNLDSNISEDSVIELETLSNEYSLSLLQERAGTQVFEIPGIKPLVDECVQRSKGLPAQIVMMGKALSYIGQYDSGLQKLEVALKEVASGECFDIALLLRCGFDMLPGGVLIDCCQPGRHFFRDRGCVHYNELIAYWMMEGYLGQVDCIEKAYEKGYHVLKELIDFRILKTVETDYVVIDGAAINLDNYNRCGFDGTASLGLANLFRYGKWEGLGGIAQVNGLIRSLSTGKKGWKLSTVLLDGNRIGREIPNYFLQSKLDLRVLAVFNPTFKSLPRSLSDMDNLDVLVLRGCHFLQKIDSILELRTLTALEISGSNILEKIEDDFFRPMPCLQSLNLSGLRIESLPSSVYDLSELRWLILRGCSRLRKLGSLRRLRNLVVLDLHGATSLQHIQDKSLSENIELQILNLSNSKVGNISQMGSKLTHLILSGCQNVNILPHCREIPSLQILDLSGSNYGYSYRTRAFTGGFPFDGILGGGRTILGGGSVEYHQIPTGRTTGISKLSGSNYGYSYRTRAFTKGFPFDGILGGGRTIRGGGSVEYHQIPTGGTTDISKLINLRHLLLKNVTGLTHVPLNSLSKLEVLDLSGCSNFENLRDDSFEKMSRLQRLDLSGTKIKNLPNLSSLCNLRHLLLKNCTDLSAIPPLESLSKLEELNLSGISYLQSTGAGFLMHMSRLQILDLSKTMLKQLPSLSNLKNLHELYLRGCPGLKSVQDLEELTKLKVLDLSGTSVSHLPPLKNFSNLRQLLLRDCSCLEEFLQLELLDLLGGTVKELPYGISELTHLERLDLPGMKDSQRAESSNIQRVDELSLYDWGISSLSAETVGDNKRPPILVHSAQLLQHLEQNHSLWDTSFKKFHFSICPIEEQNRKGGLYFRKDYFISRDIYVRTRYLTNFEEQRSLEISGFDQFPEGVDEVLSHADYVFFIDNTFKRWISDLGASNLRAMKGCWIEKCTKMESIFLGEEEKETANLGNTTDVLSNCSGNLQFEAFQNLKCLYLDCCPKLRTVCSSSELPKNLQVLHIKFCNTLETLFEKTSQEPESQNLNTLLLWELPELKTIGCAFPSLQTLKIGECPLLEKVFSSSRPPENLITLQIRSCYKLERVFEQGTSSEYTLQNLETLHLQELPRLERVFEQGASSKHTLQNLKTLHLQELPKLERVFEQGTSSEHTLQNLKTLHLQELPKLGAIGAKFQPQPDNCIIINCPNCKDSPEQKTDISRVA